MVNMRFLSFLWSCFVFVSLISTVGSVTVLYEDEVPEISVVASFPEDNPFGQVVNGEKNKINLVVENKSEQNVTLMTIAGSFHDPESNSLIKNTTTLSYGLLLLAGTKLQIPYTFHSEYKTGDIKLHIWLNHLAGEKLHQVTAYESIVTVVEPEISFFDFQLITTYLLTGAFIAGLGYFAFITFLPKSRRSRRSKNTGSSSSGISKSSVSAPVGTVKATGAGGYEEEWIPEHHLRSFKKKGTGAVSSGDELSTGDASGKDTKKRKGRR